MTTALDSLVAATEAALAAAAAAAGPGRERVVCERIRPAMEALLADPTPVPPSAYEPFEGEAVGNLLHSDADGRFHVLAVVFPQGTSSGVHHHGCWGVIGYLQGGDEETRYQRVGGEITEASRHVWRQGDVTYLLPEEGEGWHRVRNPGPGAGVSVHVLCMTPADHPHDFYDRSTGRVVPYPFVEVAPGRWRATPST